MENSRKSRSGSLARRVETALRGIVRPGDHLIVALSGGVDSVVLLNLLVPLSTQMEFSLSAVHVNHGISPNAAGWSRFCDHLCQSQGVPLHTVCVKIRREPAISLEAAAREARYGIFGRLSADYIVLAQHLDDQAETLMLQLLRGAGVKGLSGMPVVRTLLRKDASLTLQAKESGSGRPPRLLRPLLEASRREIEGHAREQGLQWITDESNEDLSFDRNFLRHEVFPRVEKRFPSYRSALLRASRHLAEASTLLDELAQADSSGCMVEGKLHVEDLRKLSFPRAKNLLRHMLAQQGVTLPSAIKLGEILRQLLSAGPDANLRVEFGAAEIRCFKGLIHLRNISGQTRESAGTGWQVRWKGEEQLAIPELGGTLAFRQGKGERMRGRGISLEKMSAQPVSIRPRLGGERLRPDCKRPRRSLKNLLREASLPPWQRGLPLMFSGEQLVYVPGIGVDCDFQAEDAEPALAVEWIVLPG